MRYTAFFFLTCRWRSSAVLATLIVTFKMSGLKQNVNIDMQVTLRCSSLGLWSGSGPGNPARYFSSFQVKFKYKTLFIFSSVHSGLGRWGSSVLLCVCACDLCVRWGSEMVWCLNSTNVCLLILSSVCVCVVWNFNLSYIRGVQLKFVMDQLRKILSGYTTVTTEWRRRSV